MNGVTIGIGEEYEFYASKAAELAKKNLKLKEVKIITAKDIKDIPSLRALSHDRRAMSFFTKFHLYELTGFKEFIYFDSDVAFVTEPPQKQLDLIEYEVPFMACLDRPYSEGLREISENCGVPFGTYINAGLYVVHSWHKMLFDYMQMEYKLHSVNALELKFGDQFILNAVLHRFRKSVHVRHLHRLWNVQDYDPACGYLPYAIHSSGNYEVYRGEREFPQLPQGDISKLLNIQ